MRGKDRPDLAAAADSFYRSLASLRPAATGDLAVLLQRLDLTRAHAQAFRQRLSSDPSMIPAMDPLIPALIQTVSFWGGDGRSVSIIHDRQNALPQTRVSQLKALFADTGPYRLRAQLRDLSLVNSFVDPRIQIADILAGTARKIAEEELHGRGDTELTVLLQPYVDPLSIWGDSRSWDLLQPDPDGRGSWLSVSSRLRILPVAVIGRLSRNSTIRGYLNAAMFCLDHSMSPASSTVAPALRIT